MPESTSKLSDALPSDALKDAGQKLLTMLVQRAAEAATDRVSGLTERLTDVSETGTGLKSAITGSDDDRSEDRADDRDGSEGPDDSDDSDSGGGFLSGLKDKVTGLFGGGSDSGGGGKGGKKLKVTQIVEDLDVGLPLRTCYDLWTQFGDFPSFMKKVESVDQVSDEKSTWKAQVFLSHREWEATIIEQVPDSHIVWKSKGAKGHVDGAVSFTALGPNSTKVLLVLEYFPQGLFERTGNIWRAQGRRARLEFKHFRRHAMATVLLHPDDVEGWRGEIHEGEVTRTHEEALEAEERERAEEGAEDGADEGAETDGAGSEDAEYDEADEADEYDDTPDDETEDDDAEPYDETDEAYDDDEGDDEGEDNEPEDDEPADEYDDYDDDGDDGESADDVEGAPADDDVADEPVDEEPEEEPAPRRRRSARREPATAGGRSR